MPSVSFAWSMSEALAYLYLESGLLGSSYLLTTQITVVCEFES